jgi:hypothetical protein
MIDRLYDIERKSNNADKIYIDLLNYYIGEGPSECLDELITKRGKRMLPLLLKNKEENINCLSKYKKRCIDNITRRNEQIDELINAIKNRVVLCPDETDCPKLEEN